VRRRSYTTSETSKSSSALSTSKHGPALAARLVDLRSDGSSRSVPVAALGRHEDVVEGGARLADHAVLARARESGGRKRPPWARPWRRRGAFDGGVAMANEASRHRRRRRWSRRPWWRHSARALNIGSGALSLEGEPVQGLGRRRRRKYRTRHRQCLPAKQPTSFGEQAGVLGSPCASWAPPVEDVTLPPICPRS
jgi:hypothetical protein